MRVNLNGTGVVAAAAVISGIAALAWLLVQFGPKLKRLATQTLNPASSENIVNQGVGAVVSDAVGYEESLGGAVADKVFKWRHPNFRMSGPTLDKVKPTVSPQISQDPFDTGRGYPAIARDPFNKTPDGDLHDGTSTIF